MRNNTPKKKSKLTVLTDAEKLAQYILTVTQKSPKSMRFTYVSRLQNYAIEAVEKLFSANQCALSKNTPEETKLRLRYQNFVSDRLYLLAFMATAACDVGCITAKQEEEIARQTEVVQKELQNWIKSDRDRLLRESA